MEEGVGGASLFLVALNLLPMKCFVSSKKGTFTAEVRRARMKIAFSKYHGTGNDFVMLDNRKGWFDDLPLSQIKLLCHRRFGIGADGVIKINSTNRADFEVEYFNSDGTKSFCGNGARCSVIFAEKLGLFSGHCTFLAIDGLHGAAVKNGLVILSMKNVSTVENCKGDYVVDTGSPHYVHFTEKVETFDVISFGEKIRYSSRFEREGINVNIVECLKTNNLYVRTYERGVEDETWSCGTGVTACALAYAVQKGMLGEHTVQVRVKGGQLAVRFIQKKIGFFEGVELVGPGVFVYSGEMDV
jgi:diaminopimelate epimerase